MLVELKDIVKEFPDAEGGPGRRVLDGLSLRLNEGESVSISGSSGCGKSTLLNIIGTLDEPTSGEVTLFGTTINGASEKELSILRGEKIGFIFQLHHLLPQLTVLENVLVPTLALTKRPETSVTKKRAEDLLSRVGLSDHIHKRPALLSGGERQRAAVVRSLINQPQMILADEPTGALDQDNAKKLTELLVELNREEQVALVLVTHDQELAGRMTKVLRLDQGSLSEV